LWHLGYTEEASAAAFTQSYRVFQHAASQQDPAYRVRGVLTDGFDSTTKSLRTLFPGARLGTCLRHALLKLPKKLVAIAPPAREGLATPLPPPLCPRPPRQDLGLFGGGEAPPPFWGPRHRHCGARQWRAGATLVSGEKGGLVCGPHRPPDAGDQHPVRSGS